MKISKKTGSGPSEAEHGQGYGDWDVDTDLPHVDFVHELPCVIAIGGEYRRAVTVGVGVDELDGVFESVCVYDAQNGTEDFFFIAFVRGQNVG